MASPALRVALVAPFGLRPKGTTSARVLPIARVLAARGLPVRAVIPPWDDPERAGQQRCEDGVEIVHTSAGNSLFGPATVIWQLLRAVRSFGPDVVHCFKPIGYSGALAELLTVSARQRRTPLVVVDADDLEGPLGWSGRRRLGIRGALRGAQEAATLRRAPLVSVASDWLREHCLGLGRSADSILYLPNGYAGSGVPQSVPPERGRVRGPDGTSGTYHRDEGPSPTLLWYTRFTEARAARVADLLTPIFGAMPDARLVVIGEEVGAGDRARLAAALVAAGLDDRVDWQGYGDTAVEDTLRHTSGPVVAIYPMDDDRTNRARCPSKVPQLMALGVPIVAEGVGEISRYLAGFEDCCIAEPGGVETFATKVIRLLQNPRLRAETGHRLQDAAVQWRWELVADGLEDWYRATLQARRASAREASVQPLG
jgi:glycosyltransferase involved in cell wall biosynthesis